MSFQTIVFEVAEREGVATITLNRPEVLNAFDHSMVDEFRQVWRVIRENDAVRAVVLRAAGDRAFSTGADVKKGGYARAEIGPFDQDDPGSGLGPKQNRVWKPVICAVQGMCAGGAFYWINEADIVICSPDAQFFDSHVTFGMVSAVEPVGALARMPLSEVMRMVLMGNDERIGAETALRISLVTEIVARSELWTRAHDIAALIATKPAAAIQGSIRAIWESFDFPRTAAVNNALKYCQLGNPIGKAEIDRWSVPKAKWTSR